MQSEIIVEASTTIIDLSPQPKICVGQKDV